VGGPGHLFGIAVSPSLAVAGVLPDSETCGHGDCSGVLDLPVGLVKLFKASDVLLVLLVEHHADGAAILGRVFLIFEGSSVELSSVRWVSFLFKPIEFCRCSADSIPFAILLAVDGSEGIRLRDVSHSNCVGGAVALIIYTRDCEAIELTWLRGGGPLSVVLDE